MLDLRTLLFVKRDDGYRNSMIAEANAESFRDDVQKSIEA